MHRKYLNDQRVDEGTCGEDSGEDVDNATTSGGWKEPQALRSNEQQLLGNKPRQGPTVMQACRRARRCFRACSSRGSALYSMHVDPKAHLGREELAP